MAVQIAAPTFIFSLACLLCYDYINYSNCHPAFSSQISSTHQSKELQGGPFELYLRYFFLTQVCRLVKYEHLNIQMGSGDWFKTVIKLKKVKHSSSKQLKIKPTSNANGPTSGNPNSVRPLLEDEAATRIQTVFRAYKARKSLRRLKGAVRLKTLIHGYSAKKQATSTLSHLHSWSKIQTQIRDRRLFMVAEGRIRQKKLENQRKLEAKLHGLEVEWSGGSDTMEEILARIHEREEAAVKRERAMAYAFSHQWRANSSQTHGLGKDELGKSNWGWSWKERWIAARPWESRVPSQSPSPKKVPSRQSSKVGKNVSSPSPRTPVSVVKNSSSNGKTTTKAKRLTYPASEKPAAHEEANGKKEQSVS